MASIQLVKAPPVGIPKSKSICHVSIINTTTNITAPTHYLVGPTIDGHEWMNLPTYAFHIKHEATGAQIVFDLGARKDWQNSVPAIAGLVENHVPGLSVEKDVHEILTEGGVNLGDVSAVILSHWHFDHSGDTGALPKGIKLLVGPGFKETFLPGFPTKEDSPFPESAFEGRDVVEIEFSDDLFVGKYQAYDYFSDGSLYILNVPGFIKSQECIANGTGHAVGHIAALVRTTKDTAVFLGGDTCHFTGSVRPSEYIPLPDEIPSNSLDSYLPRPCACIAFTACHPKPDSARTTPFYNVSTDAASFYHDPPTAEKSIRALAEFDADPNVLLLIAHDVAPLEVMKNNFFPNGSINDWQLRGYKEQMHWSYLNELPFEGKARRNQLVDGLYKEGKKIRGLELPS